ncbi:MAG: ABC transporter permease [Gammaproteobacteria bacterium]|nr:MAG: ABC transporter permease [Gammaproteobacteria bacterium]
MRGFMTVLRKECTDNIRDRRTIISSFSLALLGPALFVGLMAFVLNTALGTSTDAVVLTVVGSENAPQLVSYLEQQNTEISREELENPKQAVIDGSHDLILVIPETYARRFSNGEINSLPLIYDSSSLGKARRNYNQVRDMIRRFAQGIGFLRLQLRGVDPSITAPVLVQEVDTASPAARALTILATLPYLLVLVIFMGGFYLAIDTTAGEREHGSLEPLLSQPTSRTQLVLGKITATSIFGAMSLVLFLASLAVAVPFVPLHKIGMSLEISLGASVGIFLVALPLIFFAASLLTVVASFAKSYKEAQTYLTIVILVPTMPLIIAQLLGVEASTSLMLVPSLSQSTLISALIIGEPVEWLHLVVSAITTGTLGAGLAWLAISLYRRESILI